MKHSLSSLELDAAFSLAQPWTVLFGPSGSGKSTILRAIAGLIKPDFAKIILRWNNRQVDVVDTAANVFIASHKRPVRWAGQSSALFPHMTVRQNLAFAFENTADYPERTVDQALQCFRLAPLGERKPAVLSGGERQRVSIARAALAANGRLLLLDEPFTGLDMPLRNQLIADLREWLTLTRTPVLSVTHDISEAFQLNAEILKLHDGSVIAQGSATNVLAKERTALLSQLQGSI